MPGFATSVETVFDCSFVKIHGAKKSGTNLIHWLLQSNCRSLQPLSLILGWKHGAIPRGGEAYNPRTWEDPRSVAFLAGRRGVLIIDQHASLVARAAASHLAAGTLPYVLVSRHPLAWFVRCRQAKPGFMGLARDPKTLADLWNRSYAAWLRDLPAQSIHIRLEELVARPCTIVQQICEAFSLQRSAGTFRVPHRYLNPADAEERVFVQPRSLRVLTNRVIFLVISRFPPISTDQPTSTSRKDRDEFVHHIDRELAGRLGYETRRSHERLRML